MEKTIQNRMRENSNNRTIHILKTCGIVYFHRPIAKERSVELNLMGFNCYALDDFTIKPTPNENQD